jgi:hypothetical protein
MGLQAGGHRFDPGTLHKYLQNHYFVVLEDDSAIPPNARVRR